MLCVICTCVNQVTPVGAYITDPVLASESREPVALKATISLVEATKQPQGQHHFNPSTYHILYVQLPTIAVFYMMYPDGAVS